MPGSTMVLAENFAGLGLLVVALPLILAAIAAVSFIPSARGHAAGPVLAGVVAAIGLLLFFAAAFARAPIWVLMLCALPSAGGIISIGLWSERRTGKSSAREDSAVHQRVRH